MSNETEPVIDLFELASKTLPTNTYHISMDKVKDRDMMKEMFESIPLTVMMTELMSDEFIYGRYDKRLSPEDV